MNQGVGIEKGDTVHIFYPDGSEEVRTVLRVGYDAANLMMAVVWSEASGEKLSERLLRETG